MVEYEWSIGIGDDVVDIDIFYIIVLGGVDVKSFGRFCNYIIGKS